MSEDKSERQMDLILNVLADVSTRLSTLTDAQARTDATIGTLTGHVQTLAGQVQTLAGQVQGIAGQVQSLTGQVQNIARQQEQINEVVAAIAESQQHTDERLNALIDIVQNDRNGSS
jgi:peptidoglycan hydrolase CwlO-like protein